jgi:hypothetical protein
MPVSSSTSNGPTRANSIAADPRRFLADIFIAGDKPCCAPYGGIMG